MKRISEYASMVESSLRALSVGQSKPASLYSPIEYSLEAGGKRLRPVLVLAGAEAYGLDAAEAMPAALAMEMFHNFTLLHDDVMDHSVSRRNRPTVCAKYGEDAAILSGDAMLTLAEGLAMQVPDDKLRAVMALFNDMSLGVYAGQALDMEFEKRTDVSVEEYIEMVRLKTGVLFGACAQLGGVLAGASEADCQHLRTYGENLGIAFQIEDDWLDTFGDAATFGKPIGGDINQGKQTFLLVSGRARGGEEAKALAMAMELPAGDMRVRTVTKMYANLKLDRECRDCVEHYSAKAMASIKATSLGENQLETFKYIVDRLAGRRK